VRDESFERETGADRVAAVNAPLNGTPNAPARGDLRSRVLAYERGLLLSALQAAGGNQRRAAAALGLLPTTFHEKLKRHGIRPRQQT
jgi:two-component system C4-dicarboxylate transport response regulator DctD